MKAGGESPPAQQMKKARKSPGLLFYAFLHLQAG